MRSLFQEINIHKQLNNLTNKHKTKKKPTNTTTKK